MDEPTTRDRLLRVVWNAIRGLTPDNVRKYPAAARAIDAGATPTDVVTAMTAASYETAFRLLFVLSAEHAEEGADDTTFGWSLEEIVFDPVGQVTRTGTDALAFLHEDLRSSDPLGIEGGDLFA